MRTAFPSSDYYEASAPPGGHQLTTSLPVAALEGPQGGQPRMVPTFTRYRSTREMPSYTPAASPQVRRRLSHGLPAGLSIPATESPFPFARRACTAHRPRSARFESARRLRSFTRWFLSYTFSSCLPGPPRLAVPGRPVVVRTAPALTGGSRIRLSSASPGCCDSPAARAFHPGSAHGRLVAHEQVIEPAARVGRRPTVKLGLHPRYPRPFPLRGRVLGAAVRRRVSTTILRAM
jgi:hypothetical protein